MANYYCEICGNNIDLDFNVEHYENCPEGDLDE
jgi:hypothetical protein